MRIHPLYHPGDADPLPQPGERLVFALLRIPKEEIYLGMVVTRQFNENFYDPNIIIPGEHFIWNGREWTRFKTMDEHRVSVMEAVREVRVQERRRFDHERKEERKTET
jgi:hypothetical protein